MVFQLTTDQETINYQKIIKKKKIKTLKNIFVFDFIIVFFLFIKIKINNKKKKKLFK